MSKWLLLVLLAGCTSKLAEEKCTHRCMDVATQSGANASHSGVMMGECRCMLWLTPTYPSGAPPER